MLALQLTTPGSGHLTACERPRPAPGPDDVVLRVSSCGVCRTDLHLVDDELADVVVPRTPGHEVVGYIDAMGAAVTGLSIGQRVGVPWLAWACGECPACEAGRENLCPRARFTGYHVDGGYAEFARAHAAFVVPIPDAYDDLQAAPLLCAGLIGYRAYRMAGDPRRLGLYGFGAAAHILAQVARTDGREVYAFTRPGDDEGMRFARDLGVTWAGPSNAPSPEPLDAAILFAPVGALVPQALAQVVPGGVVVCAGIHMSDIPSFPYRLLWQERVVRSVANLTRRDAHEFMAVATRHRLETTVQAYPLARADDALQDLRAGRVHGAAVLEVGT